MSRISFTPYPREFNDGLTFYNSQVTVMKSVKPKEELTNLSQYLTIGNKATLKFLPDFTNGKYANSAFLTVFPESRIELSSNKSQLRFTPDPLTEEQFFTYTPSISVIKSFHYAKDISKLSISTTTEIKSILEYKPVVVDTESGESKGYGFFKMEFEVQRNKETFIEFPPNALVDLENSPSVVQTGNAIRIFSKKFGTEIVNFKNGVLIIKTVPGYKTREIGKY